ncbi:MAG: hypothetical protein JO214_12305, partial [Frankiaceae bacterium]|nr:hypothetical protein [Frankiaceae bacterium]
MTAPRRVTAAVVLAVAAVVATAPGPMAGAATARPAAHHPHRQAPTAHLSHPVRGVPRGAPPAAKWTEPKLPRPSAREWPFGDMFSRTSGTGRLAGGASYWTDWLFDDHGATAPTAAPISPASTTSDLAPTQGVAAYPSGPAKNNGADIFRAAVGTTRKASYWRVDWTTLVDQNVPIAEWTFDRDGKAKSGTAVWPAAAGVTSPGIDRALVVSAKRAELYNTRTGHAVDVAKHGGRISVDRRSRSFIVR